LPKPQNLHSSPCALHCTYGHCHPIEQGDQPRAIEELCDGLTSIERDQVLLGVTGSGKTFTMAKIIEATQRPALIIPKPMLRGQIRSLKKTAR